MVVEDLTIQDVASGMFVAGKRSRITLTNVTMDHCFVGLTTYGRVLASEVTITNSTSYGINAGHVVGTNVTALNNSLYGVGGGRLRIQGLTANGNGDGVLSTSLFLLDSTVTGNGVDLSTIERPHLRNTTCDTSQRSLDSGSWGVCTND